MFSNVPSSEQGKAAFQTDKQKTSAIEKLESYNRKNQTFFLHFQASIQLF